MVVPVKMRLMDSEGMPMDLNISKSLSYCDLFELLCLDLDFPPKDNPLKNSRIDIVLLRGFVDGIQYTVKDF